MRKQRVEETLQISIPELLKDKLLSLGAKQEGIIAWQHSFLKHQIGNAKIVVDTQNADRSVLELIFSTDGQSNRVATIPLVASHPPFGGARWWFLCPACNKKRTHLYFSANQSGNFICRDCEGLTYRSCQTSHYKEVSWPQMVADSFIAGGVPRKMALKFARDKCSLMVGKVNREANYLGDR